MERDEAWVLDMLLAARKVRQFTADANWEAFSANEILQNAVMHQIQVIGEAATKISPSFLDAHPEIPWPQIIGMRHRLVHGYFRIQAERVWEVVEHHLEALIPLLEPLVPPPGELPRIDNDP